MCTVYSRFPRLQAAAAAAAAARGARRARAAAVGARTWRLRCAPRAMRLPRCCGAVVVPREAVVAQRSAMILLLLPLLLCILVSLAWSVEAPAKRANLWLSTADCCGHPSCGDLFDAEYGRSHGLNTSYFEALRPWASTLDALLIDCGHRLTTSGALQLPNATQMRRLRRARAAFAALNVSVIPMIFADYDRADLGLDALSRSGSTRAAFIAAAARDATANGWGGFNIDWEPCTGTTKSRECGTLSPARKWPHIPAVLGQLHNAMARAAPGARNPDGTRYPRVSAAGYACDRTQTAPTFSHCPYGNASLMNASDFRGTPLVLQTMGTYTTWAPSFDQFLEAGLASPGVASLGVGLNTAPNKAPHAIPRAEIERRFRAIQAAGVLEVDVFRMGPSAYGRNLLDGGWMDALATWRAAPLKPLR
jgi:hypothetical protein